MLDCLGGCYLFNSVVDSFEFCLNSFYWIVVLTFVCGLLCLFDRFVCVDSVWDCVCCFAVGLVSVWFWLVYCVGVYCDFVGCLFVYYLCVAVWLGFRLVVAFCLVLWFYGLVVRLWLWLLVCALALWVVGLYRLCLWFWYLVCFALDVWLCAFLIGSICFVLITWHFGFLGGFPWFSWLLWLGWLLNCWFSDLIELFVMFGFWFGFGCLICYCVFVWVITLGFLGLFIVCWLDIPIWVLCLSWRLVWRFGIYWFVACLLTLRLISVACFVFWFAGLPIWCGWVVDCSIFGLWVGFDVWFCVGEFWRNWYPWRNFLLMVVLLCFVGFGDLILFLIV